jgi:hypothetical protein
MTSILFYIVRNKCACHCRRSLQLVDTRKIECCLVCLFSYIYLVWSLVLFSVIIFKMNATEIEFFHRHGFVELSDRLDESLLEELRTEADRRASSVSRQDLVTKHGCVLETRDLQNHAALSDVGWQRNKRLKQIYIDIAQSLMGKSFLVRLKM